MPSVGATSVALTPTTQSANYTATGGQLVLANAANAAFTVTLPASPYAGATVSVKKTDVSTNAVIVACSTSATIDGDSTAILLTQYAGGTFVYDGANWRITATTVFNTASTAVAAGGLMPWGGGRWFTKPIQNVGVVNVTWTSMVNWTWFPMYIPNPCVLSKIALYATGGANNVSFGIWTDAGGASVSKGPGTQVGSVSGQLALPNNSVTVLTISSITVPAAGVYWIGLSFSAQTSIAGIVPINNLWLSNPPTNTYQAVALYSSAYTYSATQPPAAMSGITTTPIVPGAGIEPFLYFYS